MEHTERIALIPAYNPTDKMPETVSKLKEFDYTVIIVNDGSTEEYMYLFEQSDKADMILTHSQNRGKGAAMKTGFKFILENCKPPYTVVTVDADGQHQLPDIQTVTRTAMSNPGTLIVGSRRLGKDAPYRSRSGNAITRAMLHTLTPVKKVYDTQSGLRAFSDELIPSMIEIEGERYEYEMNMLIGINDRGFPIKEVRIQAVYIGDNSCSHFRTWYDAQRIYRIIFKRAGKGIKGTFTRKK